jgi:ribosomal protein S18 acetylase RimI-like enzyme
MFVVEDYDLSVLNDPEKHILSGGGNIWMLVNSYDEALGTCSLMEHERGFFELTKMAVSKKTRGKGLGRELLNFVIDKAYELRCEKLFLLTNTKCEAAIHLYYESGFKKCKEIETKYGGSYDRCNLGMVHFNHN